MPPCVVPLFAPTISLALFSAGHQLTIPGGGGAQVGLGVGVGAGVAVGVAVAVGVGVAVAVAVAVGVGLGAAAGSLAENSDVLLAGSVAVEVTRWLGPISGTI